MRTQSIFRIVISFTLFSVIAFIFQNCGKLTAGSLISNSEENDIWGSLTLTMVDQLGTRDLAVPEEQTLFTNIAYKIVVENGSADADASKLEWQVSTVPENACLLSQSEVEPDTKLLICTNSAALNIRATVPEKNPKSERKYVALKKSVFDLTSVLVEASQLYKDKCSHCHGERPDARARLASVEKIDGAIMTFTEMASLRALPPSEIRAIAAYLGSSAAVGSPTPGSPTPASPTPAPETPTPTAKPTVTPTATPTPPIIELDGAALYNSAAIRCYQCHGPLATSTKRGATVSRIQNGIATILDMKFLETLTSDEILAISIALGGSTPTPTPGIPTPTPGSPTPTPTPTATPTPPPSTTELDGAVLYSSTAVS